MPVVLHSPVPQASLFGATKIRHEGAETELSSEYTLEEGEQEEDDDFSFEGNNGDEKEVAGTQIGTAVAFSRAELKALEEKKEVTYSAYGINLENTCKLLSCSKQIALVGKNDVKSRRMFVTGFATSLD